MEPDPTENPSLVNVRAELVRRELIFHRPEDGMTRAGFTAMTEEAFREVGASGRCYSRDQVLDVLEERRAHPVEGRWETRDFHCLELAANLYLLTYTLIQSERVTRRATIWRRTDTDWKIVYHQGTVVADP